MKKEDEWTLQANCSVEFQEDMHGINIHVWDKLVTQII